MADTYLLPVTVGVVTICVAFAWWRFLKRSQRGSSRFPKVIEIRPMSGISGATFEPSAAGVSGGASLVGVGGTPGGVSAPMLQPVPPALSLEELKAIRERFAKLLEAARTQENIPTTLREKVLAEYNQKIIEIDSQMKYN